MDAPQYPLLPDEGTLKGLTGEEAKAIWIGFRWNDGRPRCPNCNGLDHYAVTRHASGPRIWRCKGCKKDFSLLSGTVFAFQKYPLKVCLLAVSLVQRNKGDVVARRFADENGLSYKAAWVLLGKVRETLATGLEHRSVLTGYTQGGARKPTIRPGKPLLPRKKCSRCGEVKAGTEFQLKSGVAKQWGLTSSVCRSCKCSQLSVSQTMALERRKKNEERQVVQLRPAAALLKGPRYTNGMWLSTRSWWSPQDRQDLTTLANARVTLDQAADALGRSPTSIAWYAKDLLSYGDMPRPWRALIAPPLKLPAAPLLVYPYLPALRVDASMSGAQLTLDVSALVARSYPDFMRADVCQIVLLAILEGKTSLAAMRGEPGLLRAFVRQYRRNSDSSNLVSLDAPRWNEDDDDSYGSRLPAGVMNRLEW